MRMTAQEQGKHTITTSTLLAHTQLADIHIILSRAAAQSASLFSCFPVTDCNNNLIPLFLFHTEQHIKWTGSTTSS